MSKAIMLEPLGGGGKSDLLAEGTYTIQNDKSGFTITFDTDIAPDFIVVYTPIIEGTGMMFMFEYRHFLDIDDPKFNMSRYFISSEGSIGSYHGSGVNFTREGVHNDLNLARQSSSYPIIAGSEWTWKALKIQN